MSKYSYSEVQLEAEPDGPFKIFVIYKILRDCIQDSLYELTSGQYVGTLGWDDENHKHYLCYKNNIHPIKKQWDEEHSFKFFDLAPKEVIEYFEKLERDTQNGILQWEDFFFCDGVRTNYKGKRLSAEEVSAYLEEVEKRGETQYYVDYVKSVVLNNQKKYLEAIRPYYEQCKVKYEAECQAKKREAEAKKREAEAENNIANFMKKLGAKLPQ